MARGAAMQRQPRAGRPVPVEELPTLADSLGGGIGLDNRWTFAMVRDLVDEVMLLERGRDRRRDPARLLARAGDRRGRGAVGIGALLAGKVRPRGPTAVVVSGRNIDMGLHHRLVSGEEARPGDLTSPFRTRTMPDVALSFSRAEYAERLAKTRAAMERAGIDLLIVTDPSNMAWLTGYDGWSFYVHQCVLRAAATASRSGTAAARTPTAPSAPPTRARQHRRLSRPLRAVDRAPPDGLPLRRASRRAAGARGTIGVEMDNYWFSRRRLSPRCRSICRMPASSTPPALVNWQRAVKSPTEIDYMRKAARIVEAMHARIVDKIEPGMRKCDLVAEIYDAGIRGVDGIGGDYPAIVPLLPSGADASAPHLTWDDQPMNARRGHLLRDRRLLQPLPLPAVAHGLPRQADAGLPRRREGDARRHGGGARGGQARQHLRGHRQRLLRAC